MAAQAKNPSTNSGIEATSKAHVSHFAVPRVAAMPPTIMPTGANKNNRPKFRNCGSFQGGSEGEGGCISVCARSEHCIRGDDAKRDNREASRPLAIPHPIEPGPRSKREYKRPAAEQWNHFSQL